MHCLILTPELVSNEFVVAPVVNKRTNAGKDEYAAFEKANDGKAIIAQEDWKLAVTMRDAMHANPVVRQLLGEGVSEEPVQWHREDGGLLCKARLDYLRSGLVVDYKTTLNTRTDDFSRSIAKLWISPSDGLVHGRSRVALRRASERRCHHRSE